LQNLPHEGDPLMTETWRWATARLLEKAPV